ncbi:hypothetical protein GCM10010909_37480 [Acidocella aquatica]|uniref:Uncharacterized protein n=1 Tax=Acidocella aquatica TaxID=1922313 RepID=A0ABQ6AGC1_9PROT|nr:hypothetical protein GCM10010909_37480 [Acidocella aquatica]
MRANVVISAAGLLNIPAYPDIPGIRDFNGLMFQGARWDHSVDVTGKTVAVIGMGASGMQIAPACGQGGPPHRVPVLAALGPPESADFQDRTG